MSLPIVVNNRPFATDILTGFMIPDGFFEASLGLQRMNAHFGNTAGATLTGISVYFESASSPAIVVTPQTYLIPNLQDGAARLLTWDIDVSAALPGEYQVSFIAENASGQTRIIRKIFVTRVQYNPQTGKFHIQAPEGSLEVHLMSMFGPSRPCPKKKVTDEDFIELAGMYLRQISISRLFEGCLPFYLLHEAELTFNHTPAFSGQFGDLPYQDPWWKTLLIILGIVLAVAAIIVGAVVSGAVTVDITGLAVLTTCCVAPTSSALFLGLGASAIGSALAAALSDVRDPFRRGQDNTLPAPGELTTAEQLKLSLSYPESVTLGKPFAVDAKWEYTRITTGASYTYSVSETNKNIHSLSHYQITAPNVIHIGQQERFIVKGEFFGPDNKALQGDQLFVLCVLEGQGPLQGRYIQFTMQDDGNFPDQTHNDGIYTGIHRFDDKDLGFWKIYVIAQDVNNAQPNMSPEQAAQIIGGMVRTHQLTISFNSSTCPLVPDGEVHVIV